MFRYKSRPGKRNIFGASLSQSLSEALEFAEDQYQRAMIRKSKLDEDFQRDIILSLLDLPPIAFGESLNRPSKQDLQRLEKAKNNIARLPEILRNSEDLIFKRLNPLFEFLDKRAFELREEDARAKNKKKDRNKTEKDPDFGALLDWTFNKTQINKVNQVSEKIGEYNTRVVRLFNEIDMFLAGVNSFVSDSGKKIQYSTHGELTFSVDSDEKEHELSTMSSGEIQIFVNYLSRTLRSGGFPRLTGSAGIRREQRRNISGGRHGRRAAEGPAAGHAELFGAFRH